MGHLKDLVDDVTKELAAVYSQDGENHRFVFCVSDTEDNPDPDSRRTQSVDVYEPGYPDDAVRAFTRVGDYQDDLDLAEALRVMSGASFARLYVMKFDDGTQSIGVDAVVFRKSLTAEQLALVLQDVADAADKIEELFFGEDVSLGCYHEGFVKQVA